MRLKNRHSRERFLPHRRFTAAAESLPALTQVRGTRPRMASSGRIGSYRGRR